MPTFRSCHIYKTLHMFEDKFETTRRVRLRWVSILTCDRQARSGRITENGPATSSISDLGLAIGFQVFFKV